MKNDKNKATIPLITNQTVSKLTVASSIIVKTITNISQNSQSIISTPFSLYNKNFLFIKKDA